ncbi:MAG: hypothetical protein MUC48_00520 [Leptolyngbya sp. Prado105]|nr:hypothetical protein [Leptolyngbya sp. Prado105]
MKLTVAPYSQYWVLAIVIHPRLQCSKFKHRQQIQGFDKDIRKIAGQSGNN